MQTPLRLTDALRHTEAPGDARGGCTPAKTPLLIGLLPGEGIGPEVIEAGLAVLGTVASACSVTLEIQRGGRIGKEAVAESGQALTGEVVDFCSGIFARRGAVVCGPGGGRFVYDLRREFDLFCKLAPIRPLPALAGTGVLAPRATQDVDILIVRENTGGLYQGEFGFFERDGARHAYHRFEYLERQVARIVGVAARLARRRSGRLCLVTKPGGVPTISSLWEGIARELAGRHGVDLRVLEIDNACYQVIADARSFDVIVAPNMLGDIVADTAALLLGGRGLSYSANYSERGDAVYQTGHGSAHDIAGRGIANPIGQILALAMLLHEECGLSDVACHIRDAIDDVVAAGWRTAEIAAAGSRVISTRAFARRVVDRLEERLAAPPSRCESAAS